MIVGVFHPALNICGGAEWVGVNIINSLKRNNHRVVLLTNEKVNEEKVMKLFGQKVNVDSQIVFPFEIFASTDMHNVYTDFSRTILMKLKCDFLIDSFSNCILPGVDATYIHFPFGKRIPTEGHTGIKNVKNLYYLPFREFEKKAAKNPRRIVFGNSKYTQKAIREALGIEAKVLYPPVSNRLLEIGRSALRMSRKDTVVTVARICKEKNLGIIPYIAERIRDIDFYIIGLYDSAEVLSSIRKSIKSLGVSDRVHILLNLPRTDLEQILRGSKIYLHTSVGEHFGVSIVEAMASGCIPITHDSGGPKEFVPEELRYKSPEEAAEKIEEAIDKWSFSRVQKIIDIASTFGEDSFHANFSGAINKYM